MKSHIFVSFNNREFEYYMFFRLLSLKMINPFLYGSNFYMSVFIVC